MSSSFQSTGIVQTEKGLSYLSEDSKKILENFHGFISTKYGLENVNNVHHYVTKEIKDSDGKLILPAGKIVDSNFTVSYFDSTPISSGSPLSSHQDRGVNAINQ